MLEIVLLGFAHFLITIAVVKGNFVSAILSFQFHFMLLILRQITTVAKTDNLELILIDKWWNKQETRQKELFWQ